MTCGRTTSVLACHWQIRPRRISRQGSFLVLHSGTRRASSCRCLPIFLARQVRTQHAAGRAHFTDHRPDFQMRRCMRSSLTCMVGHWEVVGKLQSVPWQWVCSVELSLAGFLAPTACLYPVQSIAIYALTWVFLLHPGSTQTPRLLRLCQDCFDEIEHIVNQERAVAGVEWRARNPNTAPHDKNPYRGRLNFCLC